MSLERNISLKSYQGRVFFIFGGNVRKRAVFTPSALMKAIKFRRYNLSPIHHPLPPFLIPTRERRVVVRGLDARVDMLVVWEGHTGLVGDMYTND